MLPTLLIGSIALPTYPLLLFIAVWAGLALATYRAGQLNLEGDHIYNAGLYGLIAGIIGARLWFVLSHWENYASDLGQALSLSRSALSTPEGAIIASLVIFIYLQRHNLPLGNFLDAIGPGLALALVIAHIGAFLGGQALGSPTSVPWAVEMFNTLRHPLPLYEAATSFVILGILLLTRQRQPWPGFHFCLFILLYSSARLFLEIFRAHPAVIGNGYLAVQLVALGAIVVTLAVMAYNFNNSSTQFQVKKHEMV